jgi:hypothetical protein
MSTDTFDESPDINKKKNEQDGKNKEDEFTWENTKKFLVSVVYLIILVLIYFVVKLRKQILCLHQQIVHLMRI